MNKSRTQYAKKNIIYGCLNKLVVLGLPFISRTIIINQIGSQYLGLNNLFTSVLQMLNLAELGFSSAIVFSMYKPIADKNIDIICALLSLYRKVYKIIGLIILSIGIILIPFLKIFIKGNIPTDINIYILYGIFLANTVLGYMLYSYKSSILVASQRNDIVNRINTYIILIQNIFQICILILCKSYYLYVIIMPIFTIINNIVIEEITKKYYPEYICKGNVDGKMLKDLKYKISGLMISKLCVTSRNSLDSIIISSFFGLIPVAIYGNYYYIMAGIQSILSIITTSISASVGNSIATETPEKNYNDMMKFVFLYAWISGVCVNCLLNLYQPFMKLWMGEEMLFPISVVIAFCIYFYSLSLGDVRSVYTTNAGLWWEGRYRSIMESIVNIVLNVLLGKYLGVIGVISATIFSILVINFGYGTHIVFKYYFKNDKLNYFFKVQAYCAAVVTLSCVVTWNICVRIHIYGIVKLVTYFFISVVVSNIIYLLFYRKLSIYKDSLSLIKNIVMR